MSVMVVTSLGEIVIDLYTDRCPLTCKNFLKLCKIKYYNGCLFHTVQKDFTAQTGDPTGTGSGGDSVYRFLFGDQARFFKDEIHLDLKHSKTGMIAMASGGEDLNASQFYLTLRGDLDYLDGKHTVFGEIAEGLDTLERINEAYVDDKGRPYKNIRIKHTYILDDPFEDPPELAGLIPDASPEGKPKDEVDDEVRLEDDWVPMDDQLDAEELEDVIREKEAHSRAVVLESIGDIPDADVKPPENVLFVCKLNPVTEDEDLHTIFSRFGNVTSAEIIRDFKTGDSLCYAFIEFEDEEACIQAYKKMDNALIDDRRIKVDFSQSVSKLWNQFRRKGSKQGQGCFKCGSIDHIAKDCPGISTVNQRNFELKDDNKQRGGENNAKYDMVFDEDERSPKTEERRHEQDDRSRKNEPSRRVPEGTKHREENRDTRTNRDSRGRRDRDYDERVTERRGDHHHHREHGKKDYKDSQSRADADNGKDREDRRDDRKRSADYDGGYKRKSVDRDRYEDRDDRSHRRRDKEREDDSYRSRKEERERRRSPDGYDERDHDRRQRRDRR